MDSTATLVTLPGRLGFRETKLMGQQLRPRIIEALRAGRMEAVEHLMAKYQESAARVLSRCAADKRALAQVGQLVALALMYAQGGRTANFAGTLEDAIAAADKLGNQAVVAELEAARTMEIGPAGTTDGPDVADLINACMGILPQEVLDRLAGMDDFPEALQEAAHELTLVGQEPWEFFAVHGLTEETAIAPEKELDWLVRYVDRYVGGEVSITSCELTDESPGGRLLSLQGNVTGITGGEAQVALYRLIVGDHWLDGGPDWPERFTLTGPEGQLFLDSEVVVPARADDQAGWAFYRAFDPIRLPLLEAARQHLKS